MNLSWKIEYCLGDLSWKVERYLQSFVQHRVNEPPLVRKPGDVNRYKTPKYPGIGCTTFRLELPDNFWKEGDTLYCDNERVIVLADSIPVGSQFSYPVKLDTVDPSAYLPEGYLTRNWTFRIHHEYQNEKTIAHWPILDF